MITSTANPQIKHLIQLQKKSRVRNEQGLFVAEGSRMFKEVPKERLKKVYVSETFYNKKRDDTEFMETPVEILSDHVFAHVSDTKSPQGILCLVEQHKYEPDDILNGRNPFLLVLDNLQDPGNMGTILRTAEGAGVTGVIMSKDCVDIYNPKTIRSTMGSVYRVPFIYSENLFDILDMMKQKGICTFAAHLNGKCDYDEASYAGPAALLIGNEGNGLRSEVAQKADMWVKIPMHGNVESLNAAIAAAVMMYEVCRQRKVDK